MLRWLQTFPISYANTEISCSCYHGSCVPCFSILVMKVQVSLSSWSQNIFCHHFLLGFDYPAPVACLLACLRRILLSTRLWMSDFWIWVEEHQLLGCSYDLFSFIGIHQIDPRSQTLWKDFFTLLLTIAQHQTWHCFRRWIIFIRRRLLTSFWLGALLSDLIVRKKITAMGTRIPREIHLDEQTKKLIPLRGGFWC